MFLRGSQGLNVGKGWSTRDTGLENNQQNVVHGLSNALRRCRERTTTHAWTCVQRILGTQSTEGPTENVLSSTILRVSSTTYLQTTDNAQVTTTTRPLKEQRSSEMRLESGGPSIAVLLLDGIHAPFARISSLVSNKDLRLRTQSNRGKRLILRVNVSVSSCQTKRWWLVAPPCQPKSCNVSFVRHGLAPLHPDGNT